MKTTIKTIAVLLFTVFAFSTVKSQSTSDDALIGKAKGAAHECLQPYEGGTYEIGSSIETTGICFVEGFLKKVTFYAGPRCTGNVPCPSFATIIVAYVYFGCEGEVMGVECVGNQ